MTPSSQADGTVYDGKLVAKFVLDALETGTVRFVEKPWGSETIIETSLFLLKMIEVVPGHQTSLQHHEVKDEVQYVMYADPPGGVHIHVQDSIVVYGDGEHVRVHPGEIHRTVGPCAIIEVTTLENDDVVRHADDYGRQQPSALAGFEEPETQDEILRREYGTPG